MYAEVAAPEPSEAWLSLGIGRLVELIDGAVVVADWDTGSIVRWSGRAEALLGYTADEACGRSIASLVPTLTFTQGWASLGSADAHFELDAPIELTAYCKVGCELTVSVTLSPIRIESQGRLLALAIMRDITERKRVAGELDARNRELMALNRVADIALRGESLELAYDEVVDEISATSGFPVVVIEHYDPEREVMVFAAARGIPAPSQGKGLEIALDQTMSGEVVRTGQPLVETEAWHRQDYAHELLRQLGTRTFVCVPMVVGQRVIGALSLGTHEAVPHVHDLLPWVRSVANLVASLIARSRAEDERRALLREQNAREQAEAAIRARDEFISIAAHELKTPVTALRAYAQLVARRFDRGQTDPEQLREGFTVVTEQAEKLSRLVVQLLDVARLEAGKLAIDRQVCDLAATVRGVVSTTQALTQRHTLVLHAPAEAMAVVDAVRIEQVLTNLLNNAVRYSPDGGRIEVELGEVSDDSLYVSVRDYGIGIPPEHRDRIFDRFYQVHTGRLGGMGLGLYISAQIVEQHGGRLAVESPPHGGTRFVLTLPRGRVGGRSS